MELARKYALPGGGARQLNQLEIVRRDYAAVGGTEVFLSVEQPGQARAPPILSGLLRMRKTHAGGAPRSRGVRPELRGAVSVVREVHVYGQSVGVDKASSAEQHRGIGGVLLAEAERIARAEHRSAKISVIAGVGTRAYYAKFGYRLDGPYMSKVLA